MVGGGEKGGGGGGLHCKCMNNANMCDAVLIVQMMNPVHSTHLC